MGQCGGGDGRVPSPRLGRWGFGYINIGPVNTAPPLANRCHRSRARRHPTSTWAGEHGSTSGESVAKRLSYVGFISVIYQNQILVQYRRVDCAFVVGVAVTVVIKARVGSLSAVWLLLSHA